MTQNGHQCLLNDPSSHFQVLSCLRCYTAKTVDINGKEYPIVIGVTLMIFTRAARGLSALGVFISSVGVKVRH